MPQTLQLLDTAVEIEEAAARIYDQFALRFADNQEYGPLFHRLAGEVREHADRVRAVRALVDGSGLQVDGMDSEHLAMLLKLANDIEEMLRDDPRDVSLHSALATSFRLEDAMAAAHAELVTEQLGPQARALFEDLSTGDRAHADLLGPEGLN